MTAARAKLTALMAASFCLGHISPAAAETLLIGNKGEDTVSFVDLATGRFSQHDFERWGRTQARHMRRVREGFSSMPILESSLRDEEVMGTRLLRALSDEVYGERDPMSVFHTSRPPKVEKRGDGYVFSFDLPFASSDRLTASTKSPTPIAPCPHRRSA